MSKLDAEDKNVMYHAVLEILNSKSEDNKLIAQEVVLALDALLQIQDTVTKIESANKEVQLSGPIFKRTAQYQ